MGSNCSFDAGSDTKAKAASKLGPKRKKKWSSTNATTSAQHGTAVVDARSSLSPPQEDGRNAPAVPQKLRSAADDDLPDLSSTASRDVLGDLSSTINTRLDLDASAGARTSQPLSEVRTPKISSSGRKTSRNPLAPQSYTSVVQRASFAQLRDLPVAPLSIEQQRKIGCWIDGVDQGLSSKGPLNDPNGGRVCVGGIHKTGGCN